jgi:arsenate reductase
MRNVLFVCTQNAGRSQMAEAFFERHAPPDLRAESAGQEPAERLHPAVVEAMAEVGIDLGGNRPKKLSVEMQVHADWAVTLACGARCPYVPAVVEDWDVADPAGRTLEEVRLIRDEIEYRVRDLVDNRAAAIRSDDTAHKIRLESLLPGLVEEFGGSRDAEQIRACADAILADYDDVPIRSHIVALAERRIAECLRAERCAALGEAR